MRNTVRAFVGGVVAGLLLAVPNGPAWAKIYDHVKIDFRFIIVGVALLIGLNLGMLLMALLAAADRDCLPEPAPVRPPARRALWLDGGEPGSAAAADRAENESMVAV